MRCTTTYAIPDADRKMILCQLLRDDQYHHERTEEEATTPVDSFTTEKLRKALFLSKTGKTPGPDGIPAEVIRPVVTINAKWLLEVFNELRKQNFLRKWKNARDMLIPIPYRPLCLLNTINKRTSP